MSSLGRRPSREPYFEKHHFLAFALFAALGVIAMTMSVNAPESVAPVQSAGQRLLAPLALVGAQGAASTVGAWTGTKDAFHAVAELDAARTRTAELELRLQQLESAVGENAELRALLDLRQSLPIATVAADVLWMQRAPDFILVIDKGRQDGVREDQSVLTPRGVVGKVLEVDDHVAVVQALLDGDAGIAVMIGDERRHVDAISMGGSGTRCRLEHVPLLAAIAPGDRVVTSGLDDVHPRNLLVGTVATVEGGGSSMEVLVDTAVDFTRLEQVLVVTNESALREEAQRVRAPKGPRKERR